MRHVEKGEIYFAQLNDTVGSEQSGLRPVTIVQNDKGNHYSPTTIIVPITSKSKPPLPTHVTTQNKCLKRKSVILAEHIRTIDKRRLQEMIGKLNPSEMHQLDKALAISLAINQEE